jgi:predicted  nucleic acid-binding Zn-ribbon protein
MSSSDLELARLAQRAWTNQPDTAKVQVGTVKKHFEALEREIERLKKACSDGQQELVKQANKILTLESEIRSIHRQHASERPSW